MHLLLGGSPLGVDDSGSGTPGAAIADVPSVRHRDRYRRCVPVPEPIVAADVSVVVLTVGDRPAELTAALGSAQRQSGVFTELVVVANGVPADDLCVDHDLDGLSVVVSPENLGIPGGRNLGVERSTSPIVAFLDDDGEFVDDGVLARCAAMFRERPTLGAIALRIVDEQGRTARRHVPRIGARDPARSGPVTAFLGGAAVLRAAAFHEAGGFPASFVYAMEETDLALRLIDRGWTIHYDGTPAVFHPATEPNRHAGAGERTMRNRVWLAHRNLPAPLAALYVANWMAVSSTRQPHSAVALARAVRAGWRTRPGPRAPIRWRTVAQLTRLGRPPII